LRSRGYTYQELSYEAGQVRSLTWFHQLITETDGPWPVHPPRVDDLSDFARLTGVDEVRLRATIAEEWYGVRGTAASDRALRLAERLDLLDEAAFGAIDQITDRLAAVPGHLRPTG